MDWQFRLRSNSHLHRYAPVFSIFVHCCVFKETLLCGEARIHNPHSYFTFLDSFYYLLLFIILEVLFITFFTQLFVSLYFPCRCRYRCCYTLFLYCHHHYLQQDASHHAGSVSHDAQRVYWIVWYCTCCWWWVLIYLIFATCVTLLFVLMLCMYLTCAVRSRSIELSLPPQPRFVDLFR